MRLCFNESLVCEAALVVVGYCLLDWMRKSFHVILVSILCRVVGEGIPSAAMVCVSVGALDGVDCFFISSA